MISRAHPLLYWFVRVFAAVLMTAISSGAVLAATGYAARPAGAVTFNKDIAPILFKQCSACHRPGGAGPFSLLTFADAQKRTKQIAEITSTRVMPPWLAEGHGVFVGERILSDDEIGVIGQWAAEGAREGVAPDLPATPKWTDGWQLGPPDLVITMTNTYTVAAEGRDVYRNFVLPIPTTAKRYVRGVELHPRTKTAHHAFLRIDQTRQSRRIDEEDAEPGFAAMNPPASAVSPDGHFLSWQPGRLPAFVPDGLAWTLAPGSDLVLLIHFQPSGKAERVQSEVGFYFTDRAPTNTPFKIGLSSYEIDLPAGATNFAIHDEYILPTDVDVLAVLPHAHYLGRTLEGFAALPDGTRRLLLRIPQWDFNWQSDFRFATPVFLPKGSKLAMQFTYDNSAANARNPNHPPQRVKYGVQSSDEMGELWLQLLPRNTNDVAALTQDYAGKVVKDVIAYNEYLLRQNPADARAHNSLGTARKMQGRRDEALRHFREAVKLKPDFDEAHYHLGLFYHEQGRVQNARLEFERAIASNPDHFKAHNNLGTIFLGLQKWAEAEEHYRAALRISPGDPIAQHNLDMLLKARSAGP